MAPDTRQAVCPAIVHPGSLGPSLLRSHRPPACPHAQHPAGNRPWTPRGLATRSRPAVGPRPARQGGALRGGSALMPSSPRGPRHGPPDPRAPRPARQHTSPRPSCPGRKRSATLAPAGASPPAGRHAPRTGSSLCRPDAPGPVLDAVSTTRCKNPGRPHAGALVTGGTLQHTWSTLPVCGASPEPEPSLARVSRVSCL